jgi:hypothetical protein
LIPTPLLFGLGLVAPVFAQDTDKPALKMDAACVVAIEGDAEWLKEHKAHVVIDKKRREFPVVVTRQELDSQQDLTIGAKIDENGVPLLLFNDRAYPVVIAPKAAMSMRVYVWQTPPEGDSESDVIVLQYIGFATDGYDWEDTKRPTTKELLKIVKTKAPAPKP